MPTAKFKGVRRRTLVKLKKMLIAVEQMDTREANRAQRFDVEAVVFFENQGLRNCSQKLQDQIDSLLTQRA